MDPRKVREWWKRWPDANVGILTGPGSFDVLDIDGSAGEAALALLGAEHGPLPETAEVTTARGRHLLFAPSGLPNTVGKLGPKLDTKGKGGYVVAPPSLHANGKTYSWTRDAAFAPAPAWIVARLRPPALAPPATAPASLTTGLGRRYLEAAVDSACDVVKAAPAGERNDTLNSQAFGLGQLVAGEELDETKTGDRLAEAAAEAGLSRTESRRTIASAFRAAAAKPRKVPSSKSTSGWATTRSDRYRPRKP